MLIMSQTMNNEQRVGLFGTVRSNTEAMTTRPANEVLR